MIKVYVKKQSSYPVSAVDLKKKLREFFSGEGVVSDSKVTVSLVGKTKMAELGKKYLSEGKDHPIHNVLSFVPDEAKDKFVYPPDDLVDLGEIIVCFPIAFEEAKKENKLIADKVYKLVEHGAYHLLGKHHI